MGRPGPPEGRGRLEQQRLKERTWELANGGMSTAAIAEHLGVSVRTVQRWRRDIVPTSKEPKMDVVFQDIGDLRAKAYRATALADIDPAKRAERNYWWGAYMPLLRVILRTALEEEDRDSSIAPQLIVGNLEEWYEDIRARRRMTPPLAQPEPEVPPAA